MAKSQESINKKEKETKRFKKQKDKLLKSEERKKNSQGGGLDNMIAYVDENGNITSTPPDPTKKKVIDVESIQIGVSKRTEDDVPAIRKGRIDFYNDQKGFGFIKEIGTQEKYFVHVNGLLDEVKEGDTVVFELERGLKGMNAVRVKKV
ncbi:MAG: cold shock domain-containing protein [Paludibacter sp.]|nr:cold shock domain-containing protein [Paludibacter sp.]